MERAKELFAKFQQRFRKISWRIEPQKEPIYFGSLRQRSEICNLYPILRDGTLTPLMSGCASTFDIRTARLRPKFAFNHRRKESLEEQLEKVIVKEVQRALKGISFFVDPIPGGPLHYPDLQLACGARFSADKEVRGLHLQELGRKTAFPYGWKFFIPKGPEFNAIEVALELDREEKVRDHRTAAYCDKLEAQLEHHLKEAA